MTFAVPVEEVVATVVACAVLVTFAVAALLACWTVCVEPEPVTLTVPAADAVGAAWASAVPEPTTVAVPVAAAVWTVCAVAVDVTFAVPVAAVVETVCAEAVEVTFAVAALEAVWTLWAAAVAVTFAVPVAGAVATGDAAAVEVAFAVPVAAAVTTGAGHDGCQTPAVESRVRNAAARYLLPSPHVVADALVWSRGCLHQAADELWVDEPTLRARLDPVHLHPAERAIIVARLQEVETWA